MKNETTRNPRYHDLSREEAFGVEARVLQRMFPLLILKEGSRAPEVQSYFSSLANLTHVLADLGLGNTPIEAAQSQGREFDTALDHSSLFVEKSIPAAEAVLCVTDALGESPRIRYVARPGLSEYDQKNSDLDMLIAHASFTLAKIGLEEEVFQHPAANDCAYIFSHRAETEPFVGPEFFSRDLWPLPGLHSADRGMVPAFETVVQDRWRDALHGLGLSGLVTSYDAFLQGMHLVQARKPGESKEASVINNNVTFNLSNGSTYIGPVAVGKNIELSYAMAADTKQAELRGKLEEVIGQVTKLAEAVESESQKNNVGEQLKAFVGEAKKEKPSNWMLDVSSKGLIEAATTVASLAGPVTTAVKAVLGLLTGVGT